MKISHLQKDVINLILRSRDIGDGWRQCTPKIYIMMVDILPKELIEKDDIKKQLRLTPEGKVVAKWMC